MASKEKKENLIKSLSRTIMPDSIYMHFRGKYLFNPDSLPFPLKRFREYDPAWGDLQQSETNPVLTKPEAFPHAVYIVSPLQRSGTNYINYLLKLHPDLAFPGGESDPKEHFLYSFSDDLQKYVYKTVSSWGLWIEDEKILQVQARNMMGHLGGGLLKMLYSQIEQDKTLLLKTPDSGGLKNFPYLFPNAKAVILVRDGRETVESYIKSWGGETIFKYISSRWGKRAKEVMTFIEMLKKVGKTDNYLLVKYDALNRDPENEMKKVLDFLGLDQNTYDWKGLREAPVLGSSTARGDQEGVNWTPVKKEEGFNLEPKWKKWSNRKKNTFKKYAGDALVALGFEKDNNW